MGQVRSTRGHHRSTVPRTERYRQVKALLDEGLTRADVARRLGVSGSYVSDLLRDPDGSKAKERKRRNGGICLECGGPTSGGDGPAERCQACRAIYQNSLKVWTREAVIVAIQRWAAEHGGPPGAMDWRHADRGYPCFASVYRTVSHPSAPFAKWADAIEAAGFPRPGVGTYERTPEILTRLSEALQGPRPHTRRFNYDEAQRLRDRGVPMQEIAARLGVSYTSIRKKTLKVAA